MNEINKPNDIFVSTLVNGNLDPLVLTSNGINAENTGLLTPDEYKSSKFVQKAFTDEKGVFNNEKFEQAYLQAANSYRDLINSDSYEKLEKFVEYNFNDLYGDLNTKKQVPSYEFSKEFNPTGVSEGVSALFEKGTSNKSIRELAQQSKIWDTDKQEWLDETADERGLFKSLFGQTLVYATWDEDGTHSDPRTGREVKHKKGDWKVNDKGQYYTETLGSRSGYGKQFVAASDTLTKEGSALNKIDFFDSDDLDKSVAGTTFKLVAQIAPYLFPVANVYYGGLTAAITMAGILPTFGKMLEGLVLGGDSDSETNFTKSMNRWEGYFKRFDSSYSDAAQGSNWGYEKIADQVADIFAQLYQMRASAGLAGLAMKDPTRKAMAKFDKEFIPKYLQSLNNGTGKVLTKAEYEEIYKIAAQKMPEVQAAQKQLSELSKRLSLGYMALTSTADVYEDALAGGYDRRTAAMAGVAATIGQYAIMMNNRMGDWFLEGVTGYSNNANKALIRKALRPYYDEISKAVDQIGEAATKQEKINAFGKLISKTNSGLRKLFLDVRDGTEPFWTNAIVEGVEEMTEEAVLDSTKAMFDLFTQWGLGTNRQASFNALENTFSAQGLERYALNAFGGFLGGALFQFQQLKVEPWMTAKLTGQAAPDIQPSLIKMISEGKTQEILKTIQDLGNEDNQVAASTIKIGDEEVEYSAKPGEETRGQRTAKVLSEYVKYLEGIIIDENANLSEQQLLGKALRDYQVIKMLEGTDISKLVINDFTKLASDIAAIRAELDSGSKPDEKEDNKSEDKNKESKEEKKKKSESEKEEEKEKEIKESNPALNDEEDTNWAGMNEDKLKEKLREKRNQLKDIISGNKSEFYLKQGLDFLDPITRNAMGNFSLYRWVNLRYNKNFDELTDAQKTDAVNKYKEWKKETNAEKKYLMFGAKAFDEFNETYSQPISDYAQNYAEIGRLILDNLLTKSNFAIGSILNPNDETYDEQSYNIIAGINQQLKNQGLGGVKLRDILVQDESIVKQKVAQILANNIQVHAMLSKSGLTDEEIVEVLSREILDTLHAADFETLGKDALDQRLQVAADGILKKAFDNIKAANGHDLTVNEFATLMSNYGIPFNPDPNDIKVDESGNAIMDENTMLQYFAAAFQLSSNGETFGLNTSILHSFLSSQNIVDSELLKRVQEEAVQDIEERIDSLELDKWPIESRVPLSFTYTSDDDENPDEEFKLPIRLTKGDLKILKDKIELNYSAKPLKDIVDNFIQDIIDGKTDWKYFRNLQDALNHIAGDVKFNPESKITSLENVQESVKKLLSDVILKTITSSDVNKFYEEISKKPTVQNPIFGILKDFDLKLTGGNAIKAIEILEDQESKLYGAEQFNDYIIAPEMKSALENLISELEIIKAVVHSQTDADLDWGNPIARNKQLARFREKYNLDSKSNLNLIPKNISDQIQNEELEKWIQKCKLLLGIDAHNFETKMMVDQKTRQRVSEAFVKEILARGSELKIKGVSVLPNDQELNQYDSYDKKLDYIEWYLRDKFKVLDATEKLQALRDLVKGLDIDFNKILNEKESSSLLGPEFSIPNSRDKLNWLASTLGRDTREYLWKEREMMQTSGKDNVVPFFAQEFVAKQTRSFMTDNVKVAKISGEGTQNVHDTLIDLLFENASEQTYIKVKGISFVNGIGGAGKTSVVGGSVAQSISNKIIYVSAPNNNQVSRYLEAIQKYSKQPDLVLSGDKHELLKLFFDEADLNSFYEDEKKQEANNVTESKYFVKRRVNQFNANIWELKEGSIEFKSDIDENRLPEIVFIDEGTHFTSAEIQLLSMIHEKYGIKFNLSGDKSQLGAILKDDEDNFQNLFMWEPPKLNQSIRAAVTQKTQNNARLHQACVKYNDLVKTKSAGNETVLKELKKYLNTDQTRLDIAYYEDDEHIYGDKLISSLDAAIESVKKLRIQALKDKQSSSEGNSSWKIGILTKLDEDGNASAAMQKLIKDAGLQSGEYVLYSPESIHKNAVQGSEQNYFIIDQISFKGLLGEDLKQLYTFATRALNTSLIIMPDSKKRELGIRNIRETITHKDELPQLANRDRVQQDRISYINDMLGDWVIKEPDSNEVKSIEEKGKKIPVRKLPTAKDKKESTTTPKKSDESKTSTTSSTNVELSEKAQDEIEEASVHTNDQINPNLSDSDINRRDTKTVIKETDGMKGWTFLDHSGLVENPDPKSKSSYIPINSGINLDLDGLMNPNQTISSYSRVYKGFERFQKALLALDSERSTSEQIQEAIKSDEYIAEFFAAINPQVRADARVKGKTDLKEIMSEWASDVQLDIDPQVYIFAKRYNPKSDAARYIPDPTHQPEEGEVLLYFGVRLSCDEEIAGAGFINQWISLGRLSQKTYGDGQSFRSKGFNAIYDAAEQQLSTQESKLAVFKLNDLQVKDLKLDSTFWIKKHSDSNYRETVGDMEKKGAIIDDSKIMLIDQTKVKLGEDDKEHYKALVIIAALDAEAEEKLGSKISSKSKVFKDKLEALERSFIYVDENTGDEYLTISGKYLALVDFVSPENQNGGKLRRAIVLFPMSNKMSYVIQDMDWQKRNEKDKHDISERVARMNPASQGKFIRELISEAIGSSEEITDESIQQNILNALKLIQKQLPKDNKGSRDAILLPRLIEQFQKGEFKTLDDLESAISFGFTFNGTKVKPTRYLAYFTKLALITKDSDGKYYTYKLPIVDPDKEHSAEVKKGWPRIELNLDKFTDPVANHRIDANSKLDLRDILPQDIIESMEEGSDYKSELKVTESWHIAGGKNTYNMGLKGYYIEIPNAWIPESGLSSYELLSDSTLNQAPDDIRNEKWQYQDIAESYIERPEDFDPKLYPANKKTKGKDITYSKEKDKENQRRFKGWHTKKEYDTKSKKYYDKSDTSKAPKGYDFEYTNAMGWNYRIGDKIKLWGRDDVFEIVWMDPKTGKFKIGNPINGNKFVKSEVLNKSIEPEAITDVVSRLVGSDKEIEYDYYLQDNIKSSILNLPGYNTREKTMNVFEDILNDEDARNKLFDFSSASYVILPIRENESVREDLNVSQIKSNPSSVISDLGQLRSYVELTMKPEFENLDSDIIGYKIITIFRNGNSDIFNADRVAGQFSISTFVDKFNEAEYGARNQNGHGSWISHIIYKNDLTQKSAAETEKGRKPEMEYNASEQRERALADPLTPIKLSKSDLLINRDDSFFPSDSFATNPKTGEVYPLRNLFYESNGSTSVQFEPASKQYQIKHVKNLAKLAKKGKEILDSFEIGDSIYYININKLTHTFDPDTDQVANYIVVGKSEVGGQDLIWLSKNADDPNSAFPIPAWAFYIEGWRMGKNTEPIIENTSEVISDDESSINENSSESVNTLDDLYDDISVEENSDESIEIEDDKESDKSFSPIDELINYAISSASDNVKNSVRNIFNNHPEFTDFENLYIGLDEYGKISWSYSGEQNIDEIEEELNNIC